MRARSWPGLHRRAVLRERWAALCDRLGLDRRACREHGHRLIAGWDRLPRYYHDTTHLLACLDGMEPIRDQLQDPNAVELALWFHDAVYWPRRHDNEPRSAQWAATFMDAARLPASQRELVVRHINETAHHQPPSAGDAQFVVDIDLGVLGQPQHIYDAFERNVRKEYRWVPWPDYVRGRTTVLRSFLDRDSIYSARWFRDRLEAQAQGNLTQRIAELTLSLEIADTTRS